MTRTVRIVVGLLVVALVAAVVALVVVWHRLDRAKALDSAESGAEKAARRAAVEMTTYDHATLDQDFAWVQKAGTAKFRKNFTEASKPIRTLVAQLKAHAEGTVVDSAADARDEDHVTVLLFVDQKLTNPAQKTPGLDQPRVVMRMVRQHGRWLVDEVELAGLTGQ